MTGHPHSALSAYVPPRKTSWHLPTDAAYSALCAVLVLQPLTSTKDMKPCAVNEDVSGINIGRVGVMTLSAGRGMSRSSPELNRLRGYPER
ncbi:hypothetical protein GPY37_14245 [Photorhabdus kayaii]|uniref:Uncharacterized protein n=1 Tax=Photorhabdus kayaii TaxID=230088 RepID=A0ABX0B4I4_9GAMM|nr:MULTISPECIES: hypothetical protein [Photorhabdus]MCC8375623.1 hypothetical protein [Photorhabdus bodei]NDL12832.1 hypothetical protein [Photorhabdus kayaii]NDL26584.1 hypothetical protein [Photorhabdus kayaii]